jgi:hypothetical protein
MFRSGSPRPLSKPRNTFSLFTTPLSRAARPLCPIRHLARCPSFSIDMSDTLRQWEAYINEKPTRDIRNTCTRLQGLYQKENEKKKNIHLKDLFPWKNDNGTQKTFEEFLPEYETKIPNNDEINLPIRYPKLLNDSGDFYAQFTHSNTSIMKKRPYESSESSNEGTERENNYHIIILFHLGPSPKRTLISRQNLIKTKSPVIIFPDSWKKVDILRD